MRMIGHVLGIDEVTDSEPNTGREAVQTECSTPVKYQEETKGDEVDLNDFEESRDDEELEEINFDQLLGDAAQCQAEFEEDREDSLEDDDDCDSMGDSMAYTKTVHNPLI